MRFTYAEEEYLEPATIVVAGVGGGGGNAVDHMLEAGINGVTFIAINTDAQALRKSKAHQKVQIGTTLTRGLGAGADPVVGREAAREDMSRIEEVLSGADMVFVTAGMGGGTGTGATPIVAEVARRNGALVVGTVTTPMHTEGSVRSISAAEGIKKLSENVDTMIVVSNQRLVEQSGRDVMLVEAFLAADDILRQGVQSITDLITMPGVINLDFADVKTIMKDAGRAIMGIGKATGEERARTASERALNSPLLEESDIRGAKGVLVNISGGRNLTLYEVNEAGKLVQDFADPSANIIVGTVIGQDDNEEVTVTVIATGFEARHKKGIQREGEEKPAETDLFSWADIDKPTFERRADGPRDSGVLRSKSDDLDIPTFLRRRRENNADPS